MFPQITNPYLFYTIFGFADAPSVHIPPIETRISVGNTATIDCHADSRPLSNITWSTDGKEVKVCTKSESCLVVVGNVSAGQHVNYTCSARNFVGSDEKSITFEGEGALGSIFMKIY